MKGRREPVSIYAEPNPYGYRININHPVIRPLYETFKKRYGIRIPFDAERFRFEAIIFEMLRRQQVSADEATGAALAAQKPADQLCAPCKGHIAVTQPENLPYQKAKMPAVAPRKEETTCTTESY